MWIDFKTVTYEAEMCISWRIVIKVLKLGGIKIYWNYSVTNEKNTVYICIYLVYINIDLLSIYETVNAF